MKKNKKQIQSVQNWIPIDTFFNNGIVKTKNNKYLKIIKIIPINYSLKSELEKKSILNSYKVFLKTCNFNIQIIIQSNKEDLSKHIKNINNQIKKEKQKNNNIINYSKKYIDFINKKNKEKNSSSKNFYILIDSQNNLENKENLIIQDLNDKYLKIKDNLIRCGNKVEEIKQKEELIKIYFSFFNVKKYLEKKEE
mgnify:CR=1 FL=1